MKQTSPGCSVIAERMKEWLSRALLLLRMDMTVSTAASTLLLCHSQAPDLPYVTTHFTHKFLTMKVNTMNLKKYLGE